MVEVSKLREKASNCDDSLRSYRQARDCRITKVQPQGRETIMTKGGFSWKGFLGISQAKARISRKIGIPLTRSGRQRKIGAAMGCLIPVLALILIAGFLLLTK
jgi:hypothetical protein